MTAVTATSAIVSATGRLIGNSRSSSGANAFANVLPPNAADKKPAKVTPICTADRNRFGFSVNRLPCPSLFPVAPRFPTWPRAEPHRETEHNQHQQQPIHSNHPLRGL